MLGGGGGGGGGPDPLDTPPGYAPVAGSCSMHGLPVDRYVLSEKGKVVK